MELRAAAGLRALRRQAARPALLAVSQLSMDALVRCFTSLTPADAAFAASTLSPGPPGSPLATRALFIHPPDASAAPSASLLMPATSTASILTAHAPEQALKQALTAAATPLDDALAAFHELTARGAKLREKHYLSLLYKASRAGHPEQVVALFDVFCEHEAAARVLAPPRATRTWHYLSFERLQMLRFTLWALVDAGRDRRVRSFYRKFVHGQPNRLSVFESDALNFLLRMECTAKYVDEEETGMRARVDKILETMEQWRFNASYSASHALFRIMLHSPEVFAASTDTDADQEERADADTPADSAPSPLDSLFLRYLDRFPVALKRDSKRTSIAVSAAAASGRHQVVRALLLDADKHGVSVDAVSFAHAVECAESEDERMQIVDLYTHANDQKRVYTTRDQDSSISNYLLLSAIYDGNFRHMMELLHEMQLYNNKASNKTVEELFQSIAQFRARAREHGDAEHHKLLAECPTIVDLFQKFANVIPRSVHTVSQGILQSLRAGDIGAALGLLRSTIWSTDIELRPEIYAQLLYPLVAGVMGDDNEFDRVEVERFFDTQHPRQRALLNALLINLCASNDDLPTLLACLDRWQEQVIQEEGNHLKRRSRVLRELTHHVETSNSRLSRRALQRVLDVTSKQLKRLREQGEHPENGIFADGMRLSYYAFLKRYERLVTWDAWTVGHTIVRCATSGLDRDILLLLEESYRRDVDLEATPYKVALEVLDAAGEHTAVVECARKMKASGYWEKTVAKSPHIRELVIAAARKQYHDSLEADERED
jgi:hypothetical protein